MSSGISSSCHFDCYALMNGFRRTGPYLKAETGIIMVDNYIEKIVRDEAVDFKIQRLEVINYCKWRRIEIGECF